MRFLLDLALYGRKGNVTLKEVAQRQAISEKYLWQVISPLKRAGLISAAAGPGGGYALTNPPASITLSAILDVLEGSALGLSVTPKPAAGPGGNARAFREIWKEISVKLSEVLESITLRDMVEKQQAMAQRSVAEFSI
mgnify:CR=1 FL=1